MLPTSSLLKCPRKFDEKALALQSRNLKAFLASGYKVSRWIWIIYKYMDKLLVAVHAMMI